MLSSYGPIAYWCLAQQFALFLKAKSQNQIFMKNHLRNTAVLLSFWVTMILPAHAQVITTIAGTDTGGFKGDGGVATSAWLSYPQEAALDKVGNIYIADLLNKRIRKVTSTGIITTIIGTDSSGYNGDGKRGDSTRLDGPFGVAVDTPGNVYVADDYNQRIRKMSSVTGIVTTIAGTGISGYNGDGGIAVNAQLNYPTGVATDRSGNVYVAEFGGNRIRRINPATGIITTIAGNGTQGYSGDGGAATNGQLNGPFGVAVDDSGNVYIADQNNNCIRKVTTATGIITTVAGTGIGGFSGDGGLATSAQLNQPNHFSIDGSGNIYVADGRNNRIRKIAVASGIITTIAGTGASGFSGDGGMAASAKFFHPTGAALDRTGNLYIADNGNERIRKISYPASVSGVAGWAGTLSIYPSPCNGHFTIAASPGVGHRNERVQITLINSLGQNVYSSEVMPAGTSWSIPVQVSSDISGGVYLLRISTGAMSAVRSVVIAQ